MLYSNGGVSGEVNPLLAREQRLLEDEQSLFLSPALYDPYGSYDIDY